MPTFVRAKLQITLKEVNKHSPYFPDAELFVDMEGSIAPDQPLVSLEAKDDDCSHQFGDICNYEIIDNPNELFEVNGAGMFV